MACSNAARRSTETSVGNCAPERLHLPSHSSPSNLRPPPIPTASGVSAIVVSTLSTVLHPFCDVKSGGEQRRADRRRAGVGEKLHRAVPRTRRRSGGMRRASTGRRRSCSKTCRRRSGPAAPEPRPSFRGNRPARASSSGPRGADDCQWPSSRMPPDRAVPQVGEFAVVLEREPQRIEIVFKADDVHRPHRPGCGLRLVAEDRRHRIRRRAETDIPDHQRRGGLRTFCRRKGAAARRARIARCRAGAPPPSAACASA